MEADHDRKIKESQTQEDITVRWEQSLNGRRLAIFELKSVEIRLAAGDELLLKYKGELSAPWETKGFIIKIPNSISNEVVFELKSDYKTPLDCTVNFSVEFVWKAATYERMQRYL